MSKLISAALASNNANGMSSSQLKSKKYNTQSADLISQNKIMRFETKYV